jgi:hypothetical protein
MVAQKKFFILVLVCFLMRCRESFDRFVEYSSLAKYANTSLAMERRNTTNKAKNREFVRKKKNRRSSTDSFNVTKSLRCWQFQRKHGHLRHSKHCNFKLLAKRCVGWYSSVSSSPSFLLTVTSSSSCSEPWLCRGTDLEEAMGQPTKPTLRFTDSHLSRDVRFSLSLTSKMKL